MYGEGAKASGHRLPLRADVGGRSFDEAARDASSEYPSERFHEASGQSIEGFGPNCPLVERSDELAAGIGAQEIPNIPL